MVAGDITGTVITIRYGTGWRPGMCYSLLWVGYGAATSNVIAPNSANANVSDLSIFDATPFTFSLRGPSVNTSTS